MTLKEDFVVSIPLTITRLFIASAVAILAGYAATQADRHERTQRRYRNMELELASITPYLHEFPDKEAQEIKKELAMKMFANQGLEGIKESKKTCGTTLRLLETALESLKSLSRKP